MKKRLFLKVRDILRCPKCLGRLEINHAADYLACQSDSSHSFPIIDGIPSFVRQEEISPEDAKWVFEYDKKAQEYDEAVKRYDEWLGIDLRKEVLKVLEGIPVKPSCRILDVSTGTGALIFGIRETHPDVACELVGTDLSIGMLRVAQRKFVHAEMEVPLFHSHVTGLPFENESFDIVTHSGGINTFKDIPAALKEWVRVLKPNGILVVADEGLSPALRKTRRGVNVIRENWLFGMQPPLKHLPPQVKNIKLRWMARDTFYVISCQKLSEEELNDTEPLGFMVYVEG